jgi:chromate reductase
MKKIGIIVGSLRKDSFSGLVAKNLLTLLKGKADATIVDISQLPLYNQDFDGGVLETPKAYTEFRQELKGFDSVIVVTPEHNRTMPAALKNVLDIGSRPWGHNLWAGKKAMIVGSSIGKLSAFGAVDEVRRVLAFLDAKIMNQPEVYLGPVQDLFDEDGVFVPGTLKFLGDVMDAFVAF